ncbi:MAG: short-chain dehydrogenase [Anaerolinea sp.]|nr:short-chain dehydrogenase [Anaerolinea sp.]
MDFYQNKLALVTGGSSGIGLALARQILLNGGHVAILARRADVLASAAEDLGKAKLHHDQKIITIQTDVSNKDDVEKSLSDFVNANGLPDMVFNSAGVAHPGRFEDLGDDIFHWMMDVNYFGTVNVLKVLVPLMQQRKSGVIVNISSIAGFIGVYGYTAYGASKFAVSGFSDALRSELKPDGIQVSIVFPPDTDTPQLTYESQFKPAVTKEIAGSAKLLDPDVVALETLKAVARKKYIVLPGSEGKLMYWLHHFVGRLLYPIMDMMIDSALKKNIVIANPDKKTP